MHCYDLSQIHSLLEQFRWKAKPPVRIVLYRALTPDSEIYVLANNYFSETETEYYALYLEDYVPGIEHIKRTVNKATKLHVLDFFAVKNKKSFQDLQPVRAADVYRIPEDSKQLENISGESGPYHVFVAKLKGKFHEDYV